MPPCEKKLPAPARAIRFLVVLLAMAAMLLAVPSLPAAEAPAKAGPKPKAAPPKSTKAAPAKPKAVAPARKSAPPARNPAIISRDPYIGAIAIDAATGRILAEDGADIRGYPASMLKLMDLLIILERIDARQLSLQDTTTVSAKAARTGGSQVWLAEKEVFTIEELLYALMIQSANDAAVALAEKVAGSTEAFVGLMNRRARELGMTQTVFHSPHGLPPSAGQLPDTTTARDFAILCRELVKRPEVFTYTAARKRPFRPNGGDKMVLMRTHNHLLRQVDGCDGLKTGYFTLAGYSVAATAARNGQRVIVVVLGSADRKVRDARAAAFLQQALATLNTPATAPAPAPAPAPAAVPGAAVRPKAPGAIPRPAAGHAFLATGAETRIVAADGSIAWRHPHPTRDGWVLPDGDLLLVLSKSDAHRGGAVVRINRAGTETFRFEGTQVEINTAQWLDNDRILVTEAGPRPRILEVDRSGKIQVEVPLRCQLTNHHMQSRMTRKLAHGNYLVPQLLDKVVREYAPDGRVVWEVATPHWPFTAIRLPNGNTLINCTYGNISIEVDRAGRTVWQVSNDDLPEPLIKDACGAQRLPNGNTVITSYGIGARRTKLLEVTPARKVVWTYTDPTPSGIHHFQILQDPTRPLPGTALR